MTTPAPNSDETSRMRTIIKAGMTDSIKQRLPHGNVTKPPPPPPPPITVTAPLPAEGDPSPFRYRMLSAFWTVASVLSLAVNVVLIALFLIVLKMLVGLQLTVNDQVSGLLGGLYGNFVKMDQATISTNIAVQAPIALDFRVPVDRSRPTGLITEIELASDIEIGNVRVQINQPGTQFKLDSPATITLPARTKLPVYIQAFDIPVQNTVPINLNVPVNIPLNQTQLHEPFRGLQQVVEPYYCLVEPNAFLNGQMVCGPNNP
jgi:hypothetical protein